MIDDVPCTLQCKEHSLAGWLMALDGELTRSFVIQRPVNQSFWLSLPKGQLDGNLLVEGATYKAVFSVTRLNPIYTLGNEPPPAIKNITGKIVDESFKPV